MARSVPSTLLAALTQPEVYPFYAVEMMFDQRNGTDVDGNPISYGPVRLCTLYGNKVIDGETYLGAGDLLSISGLEEVNDLSAKSASITLSGVPGELVSLALKEPYQRRNCRILFGVDVGEGPINWALYQGAWQDSGIWIDAQNWADASEASGNSVEIFSGKMNQMPIEDSGDTSTITLTVESKMVELGRARTRRYTHESHQARHPGDTFFSFVADIQDKGIPWGRKEA